MKLRLLWGLALIASCATSGQMPAVSGAKVRMPSAAPSVVLAPVQVDYDLPSSPWPERQGTAAPRSAARPMWQLPSPYTQPLPMPAVAVVPEQAPAPTSAVVNAPPAAPAPSNLRPAAAPKPAQTPAKPATVPVKPQPTAKPAVQPPTAAATASLLPTDRPTGSDFRWQDVNAIAGDAVTLHFDKTNWLYLDPPAQQKTLGFQSITRDNDATSFEFKPTAPGDYTLEFQRQDLANQSTDVRRVHLTVMPPGTRTAVTGTALSPQVSGLPPDDSLETSRRLAASGRTSEAVKKLLQTYKAGDARTNLELARLLNQDGLNDEALGYLDSNLTLPGPDFQGTLELGTKLAAARDAQKRLPTYVKLWSAGTLVPPEDLYLQVFDALRAQKLPQVKDWAGRYTLWYPQPALRDRYLFELGQFLEEPGDNRDVQGAWQAYTEVVNTYPLSLFWKQAGERAAYINRHFLQAR